MQAIRVTRTLDSETISLPQLRPWVGQQVEIIVLSVGESVPTSAVNSGEPNLLTGSVLRYDDPFEPAVDADDWEVNQ